MNPIDLWYFEEYVKVLGTIAAIVGGIIAAWKAIAEWKRATQQRRAELEQRKQEFRQKQAMFARDIIKDIFADKRAFDALTMLDFGEYEYKDLEKNEIYSIRRKELQPALESGSMRDPSPGKERFIRRSFESLYDQLERVQNLLDVGVLNSKDLETTFCYYMRSALKPDLEHPTFLRLFEYPGVERFMQTFGSIPVQAPKPRVTASP